MAIHSALSSQQSGAEHEPIWRGPLVPIAFAATAGIWLDRTITLPLFWTLLTAAAGVLVCQYFTWRQRHAPALILLLGSTLALGAAYHHWRRDVFPSDDVGHYVNEEPRPVSLRGVVDTEPLLIKRGGSNDARELRSFAAKDGGRLILNVSEIKQDHGWQRASGRGQVHLGMPLFDVHVGDEVEVAGRLEALPVPAMRPSCAISVFVPSCTSRTPATACASCGRVRHFHLIVAWPRFGPGASEC
jgi:hypothetical protein